MFTSIRARPDALLSSLLAVGLIAALLAPSALGAGYGRGKFTGQGDSQFDQDRPKTPVEIKVKGKRVRILKMVFVFDCAADAVPIQRTIATRFFKVKSGPAGGGAFFTGSVTPEEGGAPLDVTIHLGLRPKGVTGTADASYALEGLPCQDDVIFNAKR